MFIKKPALWLCLTWLCALGTAQADVQVVSQHRLVQAQSVGTGSLVTLDITIRNAGSSYLNGLKITAQGPFFPADPDANALLIDALPAGGSYRATWHIPSDLPAGQMYPGLDMPVQINVKATDETGIAHVIGVASKAEVK